MKKLILICTILVFTFIVKSVAQKVTIDYEKSTDFSEYKSYTFLGWQENINQIMNDFDMKRIREAFQDEMSKRKLENVESDADIVISLFLVEEQKTSTTSYTNYYGMGAGRGYRRGGRRGGWGGGHSTTNYSESDYLEGTMVMDVFDGRSQEMIWQGVATKTINEKPEKREKGIPKAVQKLMKKFPIEPVK